MRVAIPKGSRARVLKWLGGFAVVLVFFGFGLRFFDGPFFVFHGGPFRSGEHVEYADVDWESLDRYRELELQFVGTERSLLLWFSVSDGRPYISCGFSCEDGSVTRWPGRLQEDSRVIVRLDGMRIQARAERVSEDSVEHDEVRARREAKFNAGEKSRSRVEQVLHDAIVKLGASFSREKEKVSASSGSRLYRIVEP